METALGLRCNLCECRDYAAAHPVPLPENPEMLRDLASVGVPGAAEKLSRMPVGMSDPAQKTHEFHEKRDGRVRSIPWFERPVNDLQTIGK